MLLALAVILLQSTAVPPSATPISTTNSSAVSVTAATDPKPEGKADTKSDAKDGEKKSDTKKETSSPITFANELFPAGANFAYRPGQTVATPIADDPGTFPSSSLSLNAAVGEPVKPVRITRKRPEAARTGMPKMWFVLGAAEHGAATFDAWSTRRNIIAGTAHELNPMMQPFANSGAMYAAVQVAPVLFDLLSKHMLHSSRSWERKSWWVPQTASTVTSILSGAHNMAIH